MTLAAATAVVVPTLDLRPAAAVAPDIAEPAPPAVGCWADLGTSWWFFTTCQQPGTPLPAPVVAKLTQERAEGWPQVSGPAGSGTASPTRSASGSPCPTGTRSGSPSASPATTVTGLPTTPGRFVAVAGCPTDGPGPEPTFPEPDPTGPTDGPPGDPGPGGPSPTGGSPTSASPSGSPTSASPTGGSPSGQPSGSGSPSGSPSGPPSGTGGPSGSGSGSPSGSPTGSGSGSPSGSTSPSGTACPSGSGSPSGTSSGSQSPSGSGSPSRTADPSGTGTPTGTAQPTGDPSGTAEPTDGPSPTTPGPTTLSPSATPTGPIPTGPTPTGPTPTATGITAVPGVPGRPAARVAAATGAGCATRSPTDLPPPTDEPTDDGCPKPSGDELTEDEVRRFEQADPEEKIVQRERKDIDCDQRIVLTAIGDSVTSAHFQDKFGAMCKGDTRADWRRLTGNDGKHSYAAVYTDNTGDVLSYYNVARTGFKTVDMIGATAGDPDACKRAWGHQDASPLSLATAIVRHAELDGTKAYVVGTAGANDTNWATIIPAVLQCRALKLIAPKVSLIASFDWPGEATAIPAGGSCTLGSKVAGQPIEMYVPIPAYNPATAQIKDGVRTMSDQLLAAGADKIVWMSYHDITPAQIDLGDVFWYGIRPYLSTGVQALVPTRTAESVSLVEGRFTRQVQQMIAGVNQAVADGMPAGGKVVQANPVVGPNDMQVTGIGGAPHPNDAGHRNLAQELRRILGT